ncbi:hypothetical protein GCM10011534_12270 [Pseudooceanicola nanhaiensis]|uniref:Head-tail adaptor protein n=1 Tax=Pseudooceanicola nanhaiensis TaxID=375761 RepID=A0A917SP90_9RHOB|nr:hypothetical protein GCM10011534_12270 [Pseudooceanicola nanhaiensis]
MRSEHLRDRVTFVGVMPGAGEPQTDEYGNEMPAQAGDLTVWANVRETLGKEKLEVGRLEDQRTATIRVRASSDSRRINSGHRAQARGDEWDVKSVAAVGDGRQWIDILVALRG